MVDDVGHHNPEGAALSAWPPAAEAEVVSVDERGDKAQVHIRVGPSYDYWVCCVRRDDRWYGAGDGNGPNLAFFDPGWEDVEEPND